MQSPTLLQTAKDGLAATRPPGKPPTVIPIISSERAHVIQVEASETARMISVDTEQLQAGYVFKGHLFLIENLVNPPEPTTE